MKDLSSQAIEFYDKQQYRKAISCLQKALETEPDNLDNIILLGYSYVSNYQYDMGFDLFNKLFIKYPENTSVLDGLGMSYHGLGKYEAALKVYDNLLAIEPQNTLCYFNRSETFIDMGLFDEAIDSLNAFLILAPGDIIGLNNRAYCYLQNKNYDKAIEAFSHIIKTDNTYPNAFLHRAKAYFFTENKMQCLYDLRKAYVLGLYKAAHFLKEWDLPPVQNSLYKAMAYLRYFDKEALAKPLKMKDYEKFIDEFTNMGINVMNDTFWMDYFIHDGLSYDGVELFSISKDALFEKEYYTLPDLITQNHYFRTKYESQNSDNYKYIYLGKTDEDLILYDFENNIFVLTAREDLLIYETYEDIYLLLSKLWGLNINNFAENKMKDELLDEISEFMCENDYKIELFEHLNKVIKEQIVKQINIIEKAPITVNEVLLGQDLCGVIVLSEPAHVYVQNIKISIDTEKNNKMISWQIEDGKTNSFRAVEYFTMTEIKEIEELINKQGLTLYSLLAGSYFLKLGDELAWKDHYKNPAEKYKRAQVFFEKAAVINSEIRYFEVKIKEILELF